VERDRHVNSGEVLPPLSPALRCHPG
jgi:hypothetical protein